MVDKSKKLNNAKVMLYTKRTKCAGCAALNCSTVEGKEQYACMAGAKMSFLLTKAGIAHSPKPEEACFKPLQKSQVQEAKKLLKEKQAVK